MLILILKVLDEHILCILPTRLTIALHAYIFLATSQTLNLYPRNS